MYPVLVEHKKEVLSTLDMPSKHGAAENGGKGKTLALTAGPSGKGGKGR